MGFVITATNERGNLSHQIIEYAKHDRVYAKGLGILDCISTLV